ncbi:hypothetical protein BH09VER1_BH09VER1_43880 [soil metagenome]
MLDSGLFIFDIHLVMSTLTDPSRYTGKPLLRLLECYTLDVMCELTERQKIALTEITPRLREIHQVDGTWQEIVVQVMKLPADTPEKIRLLWEKNLATVPPQPRYKAQAFAERFVDYNLAPS